MSSRFRTEIGFGCGTVNCRIILWVTQQHITACIYYIGYMWLTKHPGKVVPWSIYHNIRPLYLYNV